MKNTRTPRQQTMEIPEDKIKEASIIDIQLKDLKGNTRSLTDLKGKVVLIDFTVYNLSLIHISEPTRLGMISYAVFCLKKKKQKELERRLRIEQRGARQEKTDTCRQCTQQEERTG